MTLDEALRAVPVVAIIRGVRPDEATDIGEALFEAGVRIVEVPLNSPEPLDSIARLAEAFEGRMVVGAGTVLEAAAVDQIAKVGGRIIVSPDTRPEVIGRAVELGLEPMPGFATATEMFQAYDAGARRLKLFPASIYGPAHVKALKAVAPSDAMILAVGGAGPSTMADWWKAGARGFGLGSDLYAPGRSPAEVYEQAAVAVEVARDLAAGVEDARP